MRIFVNKQVGETIEKKNSLFICSIKKRVYTFWMFLYAWIEWLYLSHTNQDLGLQSPWWLTPEILLGSHLYQQLLNLRFSNSCHLGTFSVRLLDPVLDLVKSLEMWDRDSMQSFSSFLRGSYLASWTLAIWDHYKIWVTGFSLLFVVSEVLNSESEGDIA